MKNMKRTMKGLAMLLAICLIAGTVAYIAPAKETQAATAKMTRLDFVKGVVDAMVGSTDAANWDIKLSVDEKGNVTVGGIQKKTIKAKTVKSYAKKYKISTEDAQKVAAAIGLGIITKSTFKTVKSKITVTAASIILAKAETLRTAREYDEDEINFVIKNRISDIKKVKKTAQKKYVAMAYMDGFIKGKSTGAYEDTRKINPTSKLTKTTAKSMIAMLTDKSKRYQFSDTWQMLRISTKKLPKNADLYEYILDSYPNAYYETGWHNMDYKEFFSMRADGKTPYGGAGTFEQRKTCSYDHIFFPSEMDEFLATPSSELSFGDRPGYNSEYRNYESLVATCEAVKDFYMLALNVDYRTIKKDKDWYQKMLVYVKQGHRSEKDLDAYIEHCINNKIIIECDKVVCDPSLAYWCPADFRIKVYAHMKVVSDDIIKKVKFEDVYEEMHDNGLGDPYYGPLFMILDAYEIGTVYTRDPLYLSKYKLGEWTDYFAIAEGSHGEIRGTCSERSPMIDYAGLYPWLLEWPYKK
ncbi:MAG: hypothetical protein K6A45_00400 [Lachnospiraceae bacterium]|nr:hypothetical protein [Lachnospiraceae bacterium]